MAFGISLSAEVGTHSASRSKIILDQFADQMGLNGDPNILRTLAEDVAKVQLSNLVAQNRGGGTLPGHWPGVGPLDVGALVYLHLV